MIPPFVPRDDREAREFLAAHRAASVVLVYALAAVAVLAWVCGVRLG